MRQKEKKRQIKKIIILEDADTRLCSEFFQQRLSLSFSLETRNVCVLTQVRKTSVFNSSSLLALLLAWPDSEFHNNLLAYGFATMSSTED